jgi:hypothetical protein
MTTPNVPPVPRAGDAPAVPLPHVWVNTDDDGHVYGASPDRNEAFVRYQMADSHLYLYLRVPDAATLDARIAALERMRRAVELLAWFTDPHDRAPLHVIHEAENLIGEIEGTIGGHEEVYAALLTDLRAARDAGGRDANAD